MDLNFDAEIQRIRDFAHRRDYVPAQAVEILNIVLVQPRYCPRKADLLTYLNGVLSEERRGRLFSAFLAGSRVYVVGPDARAEVRYSSHVAHLLRTYFVASGAYIEAMQAFQHAMGVAFTYGCVSAVAVDATRHKVARNAANRTLAEAEKANPSRTAEDFAARLRLRDHVYSFVGERFDHVVRIPVREFFDYAMNPDNVQEEAE